MLYILCDFQQYIIYVTSTAVERFQRVRKQKDEISPLHFVSVEMTKAWLTVSIILSPRPQWRGLNELRKISG